MCKASTLPKLPLQTTSLLAISNLFIISSDSRDHKRIKGRHPHPKRVQSPLKYPKRDVISSSFLYSFLPRYFCCVNSTMFSEGKIYTMRSAIGHCLRDF